MRLFAAFVWYLALLTQIWAVEAGKTDEKSYPLAPDFVGIAEWLNSDPLHIEYLRGHVVLIDFWDYSCINCLRTLPHLERWYENYREKGFIIVGVHTPEFSFAHDTDNVLAALRRYGITYPVALDNSYKTWRAYNNRYWPTSYLLDTEGRIRLKHIGEGNYQEIENAIRKLLDLPPLQTESAPKQRLEITPEIYLGSRRAQNYSSQQHLLPNIVSSYGISIPLEADEVGLRGLWRATPESITSAGSNCKIELNFLANRVFLVLSGSSPDPLTVMLDDKLLPEKYYTSDMDSDGQIFLDGDRKYDIVTLRGDIARHTITIHVPPGISAYAFTFGSES